jgi:hypothetical protein
MVALAFLLVLVAIVVAGEWFDARFQRHHVTPERWPDAWPAPLPEPPVPSTVQRSSGGG